MESIIIATKQGKLRIVSSGSYSDLFGTGVFVLEADEDNQIVGANVTQGNPDKQSAFRSELGGLYGALLILLHIYDYFGPETEQNTVKDNNLTAVQTALDISWHLHAAAPHCNLQTAILPKGILPGHICGHQDTKKVHKQTIG